MGIGGLGGGLRVGGGGIRGRLGRRLGLLGSRMGEGRRLVVYMCWGGGEKGWMSVNGYLEATRIVYMGTEYMTQA